MNCDVPTRTKERMIKYVTKNCSTKVKSHKFREVTSAEDGNTDEELLTTN